MVYLRGKTVSEIPNHEIMKQLTKMALEQATEELAKQAERFAKGMTSCTGEEALLAFAAAIRSTNQHFYGNKSGINQ